MKSIGYFVGSSSLVSSGCFSSSTFSSLRFTSSGRRNGFSCGAVSMRDSLSLLLTVVFK